MLVRVFQEDVRTGPDRHARDLLGEMAVRGKEEGPEGGRESLLCHADLPLGRREGRKEDGVQERFVQP